MEKCLPESIKEKIRYKQSIEDVWMYFMRPVTFPHDPMLPVNTAKAVLDAHIRERRRQGVGMTPEVQYVKGRWVAT
jgi:hypothetical protein